MPDFDVQQVVEAAAGVLSVHRWKSMGVASVECECGEILFGDEGLIQFPADAAFRKHLATAALAVIVPAVTAQIRALHEIVPHEGAPGWLWCHGCRHSVSADVAKCPTVRLLDQLEAVARGGAV